VISTSPCQLSFSSLPTTSANVSNLGRSRMRTRYDKLVRDRIPEIVRKAGKSSLGAVFQAAAPVPGLAGRLPPSGARTE
jgi:hypothetical protein